MATQKATLIQPSTGVMSADSPPSIQSDGLFQRITKFATEANLSNIQTAREEQYVQGRIDAAQNNGVKEVREQTPWVAKLFGGGASLSGAMDYMEEARILDYKNAISSDMDNLRQLDPEDFKTRQMDDIQQFMTDDDATNAKIMRTFGRVLPDVTRIQAKEHEAYKQELNLKSLTNFAQSALKANEEIRSKGDVDETARTELDFYSKLDRPAGMNADAYKKFLYDTLGTAAATGDTKVEQKIRDLNLVDTPADVQAIDKARLELEKYQEGQRAQSKAQAYVELEDMAQSTTVSEAQFNSAVAKSHEENHYTWPQMKALYEKRSAAQLKASKHADYSHNIDLLNNGHPDQVPPNQLQDTLAVWDNKTQEDPSQLPMFVNALAHTDSVSAATRKRWRAGIGRPVVTTADGIQQVNAVTDNLVKEWDSVYLLNPDVLKRTMDDDTYGFYTALRDNRDAMAPGTSEVMLFNNAIADVQALKDRVTVPLSFDEIQQKKADFVDDTIFTEDNLKNSAFYSDYANASKKYGGSPDNLANAYRERWLMSRWDVVDGNVYRKINGKSLAQQVGVSDPIKKAQDIAAEGESFFSPSLTPIQSSDGQSFDFVNDDGYLVKKVTYAEIRDKEHEHVIDVSTQQTKEARAKQLMDGREMIGLQMLAQDPSLSMQEITDKTNALADTEVEYQAALIQKQIDDSTGFQGLGKDLYDASRGVPGTASVGKWLAGVFGYHPEEISDADKIIARYQLQQTAARLSQKAYAAQEENAMSKVPTYYGKAAIKKVEEKYPDLKLTPAMREVIQWEGFVDGVAKDKVAGIMNSGVGQAGEYMDKTFEETFTAHKKKAATAINNFNSLDDDVQTAMILAAYRGDLAPGFKWAQLFNEGKYDEAAAELYNHKELQGYLFNRQHNTGFQGGNIVERFKRYKDAILSMKG